MSSCMRRAPSTAKPMNSSASCVELAPVAPRQELRVAGHHAQRLLQVVRGHVGELLQLAVGARQLGRRSA